MKLSSSGTYITYLFFFFNDTATTEIYTLSLHDALPISEGDEKWFLENEKTVTQFCRKLAAERPLKDIRSQLAAKDRKSGSAGMPRPISYAVFCLKKKKRNTYIPASAWSTLEPCRTSSES